MHKVETKSKKEANQIVGGYKGPVFTDRVGRKEVEAARRTRRGASRHSQPGTLGRTNISTQAGTWRTPT